MLIKSTLFDDAGDVYRPKRVKFFEPDTIVLAKGSVSPPQRRRRVERICRLYPAAQIIERLDQPHNRIDLGIEDFFERHRHGKRTLVLAEHKSPVRFSKEQDNACPNYWHFSPYGFCPYDCAYCYLAGTRGVWFSPTVKVFLNLEDILSQIDKKAREAGKPTAFYLGKLQEGLALDPLTGYSRRMVPFFARHPFARQVVLTKSGQVNNLLDLDHRGHTILSWSLNPANVCRLFETNTPSLTERLEAMQNCAAAGYPIRAVVMPIIPVENWEELYASLLWELLKKVSLQRITFGGICSYPAALRLTEKELGNDNLISQSLAPEATKSADGRARYPESLRVKIYRHLMAVVHENQPGLSVGLCLEERSVFDRLGLTHRMGQCNCVL